MTSTRCWPPSGSRPPTPSGPSSCARASTFSDGTPFDAEAAKFSIDRAVNSDLGCNVEGYVFGETDLEVEATDPQTLTVTTPAADPILPLRLSFVEIVPTSTDDKAKVREPIGTGPYAIKSWEAGQKLTLGRQRRATGATRRRTRTRRTSGAPRAASAPPWCSTTRPTSPPGSGPDDGAGDTAVAYPNNETTAIRIQTYEPPLDDIRVRQAINYAHRPRGHHVLPVR